MATLLNVLKSGNIDEEKVVVLDDRDVKLVQDSLLQMFDDIISTCNEAGIKYQLGGGSALGAIRHKGFIPWDDDIDINMRRCDVNSFIEKFIDKYHDKYWVHIPGITPNYDYMMIRILSKNIRARELMDPDKNECGLCIDIFVVENTFDNAVMRKIHGIGCMFFRYALSCIRFNRNEKELKEIVRREGLLKKYAKKRIIIGKLISIIPLSIWTKAASKWITMCKDNQSKFVVIPSGQHQFFKEMYIRKDFCRTKTVEFEERKVSITASYDTYLKNLYANYMEIPPQNKREKHIMLELDKDALDLNNRLADNPSIILTNQ